MKRGPKVDPTIDNELNRHTVMLDTLSVRRLRVLGKGNLSDGIRRAARVAYDRYQVTPDRVTTPNDAPGEQPTQP